MKQLSRKTNLVKNNKYTQYTQNNIFLKPENLQVTGSIKLYALENTLKKAKQDKYKKVVTISSGNTAKAMAYIAKELELEAEVYLPLNTSYSMLLQIENLDAKINLEGANVQEIRENFKSKKFDDDTLVIDLSTDIASSTNYGCIVEDIINDNPEIDILLVPVGTGSLLYGIINYIKEKNLNIKVYATEPYNHASLTTALKEEKPTYLKDAYSIAETINSKVISDTFFKTIKENIAGVITVSDEELVDCFLDVVEENKFIVETSGLLALAGSKYLKEKNKNVVALLTSGNVDITTMSTLLQFGLNNKGRIFTFKTMLSDKPGELLEISATIAKHKGNIIGVSHNQLTAITRQNKVEIIFKVESLGLSHKFEICKAIENKGYQVDLIDDHLGCDFDG